MRRAYTFSVAVMIFALGLLGYPAVVLFVCPAIILTVFAMLAASHFFLTWGFKHD